MTSQAIKAVRALPPTLTIQPRVQRIATEAMIAMQEVVAEEVEKLRRLQAVRAAKDLEMERACAAVGAAVDKLLQSRNTRLEIPARHALEVAAGKLNVLMKRREADAKR